jgi:hypothetical protein
LLQVILEYTIPTLSEIPLMLEHFVARPYWYLTFLNAGNIFLLQAGPSAVLMQEDSIKASK